MKSYKHGKYTVYPRKRWYDLALNEMTTPRTSGRYRGVSIGRDRNGYFVTTHRARSESRSSPAKIPEKAVKFIQSTG